MRSGLGQLEERRKGLRYQFAGMEDFPPVHGANFVSGKGEYRHSLSFSSDEFHLVRVATGISVDDGPNVAALQSVPLDVMQ
jgi:hypothetical protein